MAEELLRIGQFAALSGISRKLLIFYDSIGLLHPRVVDRVNGYRYYSYRQIDTASVIVSLRQAGMSLGDIQRYLSDKSPDNLIAMLDKQEKTLERQIRERIRIQGMIRARIAQTRKGTGARRARIHVERQPNENLFVGPKLPDDYDLSEGWTHLPDFYADCKRHGIQLGFTVGTVVSHENVARRLWNKPSNYFYRLPAGQYPDFVVKPEGIYVVGVAHADYGVVAPLYEKLLSHIRTKRLHLCGNAYEEYLIDEIAEEDPDRYLLQIAIEVRE